MHLHHDPVGLGRGLVALPVGLGHHHFLEQSLHVPLQIHELHRQPVEQLRMRGRITMNTPIAGRADNTHAEMVLPEPINHHSRRKGVVLARQPARQGGPPAG